MQVVCSSVELKLFSQDLYVVGLPPVAAYDGGNPGPCIVSLINTIWTLLYHRQNLVDYKRDLEQKITVLTNECDYVKVRLVRSTNAYNRIGCVCKH